MSTHKGSFAVQCIGEFVIGKAEIFTLQIQYTGKQPSFQTQPFLLGDRLQIEEDRDPRSKGERGAIYKPVHQATWRKYRPTWNTYC